LDGFTNALGYGAMTFLAGWLIQDVLSVKALLLALATSLAVGGVYIMSSIWHIEEDKKSKIRTFGVRVGARKGILTAMILGVGTIAILILLIATEQMKIMAAWAILPAVYILWGLYTKLDRIKEEVKLKNQWGIELAFLVTFCAIIFSELV